MDPRGKGFGRKRGIPVNYFAVVGGRVGRLGLNHRGWGCRSGGRGIWVCLFIAVLQCGPLDGASLLQSDLRLAFQQLILASSGINLYNTSSTL